METALICITTLNYSIIDGNWSRVKKQTNKQTNLQDHGKVSSCLIASCFAGAVGVSKRM